MKRRVMSDPVRLRAGLAGLLLAFSAGSSAQVATAPTAGIIDRTPRVVALTHARLVIRPGEVVDDGVLVIRDGVIVAASAKASIPSGASVIDMGGRSLFAGFVDANSNYGLSADEKSAAERPAGRQPYAATAQNGSRHWNRKIRPETDVADLLKPDAKRAEALRKLGFTSVLTAPPSGVLRGQGALLSTAPAQRLNEVMIAPRLLQSAAFEINRGSDEYPTSLMGSIALLRQTFHDAQWQPKQLAWQGKQRDAERVEANLALDALRPVLAGEQPLLLNTDDELDIERAQRVAAEFKLKLILAGNGYEYRRASQLKAAGSSVIVPLTWPEAPAIEDPDRALDVSLAELEHWERAPFNARVLAEQGVPFAFTSAGLKKPETEFWSRLRKAVASGLDEDAALAALTTAPAQMLGVADKVGSLQPGRLAHFVVADADLFRSEQARIREVWIDGRRLAIDGSDQPDARGAWALQWSGVNGPATLQISGDKELTAKVGDSSFPALVADGRLLMYPPGKLLGLGDERVALSAALDDGRLDGRSKLPDGREIRFNGQRERSVAKAATVVKPALPVTSGYPAGEFGRSALPAAQTVLVRDATLWTQSAQGTLERADLLVEGGRIRAIGSDLAAPRDAVIIDGKGLHVSPGIIDAHSHIAIARGVNEGSHAVTSEVRIGDVLDPTDINVYRQLAGGITTSHLLHGSANPIGGQSALIKLRWGSDADGLLFDGAATSIKFALGENVKQSNWGPTFTTRYPQSRMGVPELIRDQFNAARDYSARLAVKGGAPVRRDLRLEALAEVMAGERIVNIHSYRQDEILAFARIAREYAITPVFQHILEGYKVADELAALHAGASTFSDWWAYKMEVIDAIPYNGALMTRQGVLVSFNSDDAEMARRLNSEAAKAIKFGGLSEIEALNLVTLNPAKQLRVDARVGSLEVGKDADFVIWNHSPLSTLAVPQQTWIDGRKYFDRNDARADSDRVARERARLFAKLLPERVKALAKREGKATEGGAAKSDTPKSIVIDSDGAHLHVGEALAREMRAPYHDGEPVHVCREQH